jgi:hypothetical protein
MEETITDLIMGDVDLPTVIEKQEQLPEIIQADRELPDIDEDFQEVQDNYKKLIKLGFETIDTMVEILAGSEHPRAAEVLSNTINVVGGLNKELLGTHKVRQEIMKGSDQESKHSVENQQNNFFFGSSNDLQKMIKEMK